MSGLFENHTATFTVLALGLLVTGNYLKEFLYPYVFPYLIGCVILAYFGAVKLYDVITKRSVAGVVRHVFQE